MVYDTPKHLHNYQVTTRMIINTNAAVCMDTVSTDQRFILKITLYTDKNIRLYLYEKVPHERKKFQLAHFSNRWWLY